VNAKATISLVMNGFDVMLGVDGRDGWIRRMQARGRLDWKRSSVTVLDRRVAPGLQMSNIFSSHLPSAYLTAWHPISFFLISVTRSSVVAMRLVISSLLVLVNAHDATSG
jgi:hypothetical protein